MKIGNNPNPTTAISTSNAETIIIRGHDLVEELIGRISFTDHIWLLITGTFPSAAQRRLLDATLVAIAEHGMVPSVQASRMTLAAAPEALQGAVAAGLLGCGSVILGSSEAAGRFFSEILDEEKKHGNTSLAIETMARRYREQRRAIPGYGHPLHKQADPRALRLLKISEEEGVAGAHVRIARAVEGALPSVVQRSLMMNISGAIPAVLLDAGFPLLALKGAPLLARTAGLIAHLLEEQTSSVGFAMSHAAAKAVPYVGPAPKNFMPDEN